MRWIKGRSRATVCAKINPDLRLRYTGLTRQEARTEKEIIETLIRNLVGLGKGSERRS